MKYGERNGVSRYKKKGIAVVLTAIALALGACATSGGVAVGSWDDAAMVAEQRAEIERQRRHIDDLERLIQSGAGHLRNAEERLGSLEDGAIEFADWLRRVDEFIRAVIAVQRELEGFQ